MASVSIIVPTISRPTLARTLDALTPQLHEGDTVIVVGDGPQPNARQEVGNRGGPFSYIETVRKTSNWGNSQRNMAMPLASGDWIAFCDDDDAYTSTALDAIHAAIDNGPILPHVFRMDVRHVYSFLPPVIWTEPIIRTGNVGTPMMVVPNHPSMLGRWIEDRYEADFWFLLQTVKNFGNVIFREELVCVCRPPQS